MNIFLAGATGAIGRRLVPLLLQAGHAVTGTTRAVAKAQALQSAGATPAVVDMFDARAVADAVAAAHPDVVIHQLTDLPQAFDLKSLDAALARNARLRVEGTRNLIEAMRASGVRRIIAQSIAFVYAPGGEPHDEQAPLDLAVQGAAKVSVDGVVSLETQVLNAPGIEGVVLRYGRLYGPGTWEEKPSGAAPLHVDAAALAAVLALTRAKPGIYNVAEEDGAVNCAKARHAFAFDPAFRLG